MQAEWTGRVSQSRTHGHGHGHGHAVRIARVADECLGSALTIRLHTTEAVS